MDKKYKALFVLHLPPPIQGASMMGQYIKESGIINSNFDCHYINFSTSRSLLDNAGKTYGKLKKIFCIYYLTIKEMVLFRPDVVYITPCAKGPSFCSKEFLLVQIIKLLGGNVVAHFHNKGVSEVQNKWYYKLLFAIFYKNIKVILLSKLIYYDFERYVKEENLYILANGIPKPNANKKGVHYAPTKLLFLSNLVESKGVFLLLDALKIVKDKGFDFVCNFVGGETHEIDSELLEKRIKERALEGYVFYLGRKTGMDKESVLCQSDLFVFPTYYPNECFPLSILEAMSSGLPIISTEEGGIPDMVRDGQNGFVCKRKDIVDLAQKIIILLENETLRKRMSCNSKEIFEKDYTIEKFSTNLSRILIDVINSN